MGIEPLLIWGLSAIVVALVVLPYAVRFQRRQRQDRERKAEASALGLDRPAAQFPYIDATRCIGCGACVDACPEGDVLGVVGGTATVINGLRCVGHARCEVACPVGAIEVGLGDLKSRKDVPLVDDSLETTVPGVFVVGELGGLSLVANAVRQGRAAVEEISERASNDPGAAGDGPLDLVIVGAGPAGVSAAVTAAKHGLRFVVLEKEADLGGSLLHYPRRKMVLTQPVEIPPWGALEREEYQKEDLLEIFESLVEEFDLPIEFGAPVTDITVREGGVAVTVGDSKGFEARQVILALGRRGTPRKLGVPGEDLPKVMYRLIDAAAYEGEKILVVGGGDSAVEAAVGLSREGANEVTLSYRRDRLVRIKQKNQAKIDELIESGAVRPVFSSQVTEIREGSVVLDVDGETMEIENDYVFVFAGGIPPFGLLKSAGVAFGGEEEQEKPAVKDEAAA